MTGERVGGGPAVGDPQAEGAAGAGPAGAGPVVGEPGEEGEVDEATARAVERFLYREVALLDDRCFEQWLALFADDATYEVPLRVTLDSQSGSGLSPRGRIFSDSKQTLGIRVQRLRTEYAWAEQPPSRTRHFVSNVTVGVRAGGDLVARCNLLVTRSRGDDSMLDLYAGARTDVLVVDPVTGFRIRHRWLSVDQATMPGNALSVFL